ncbi:HWE histidine kinase domain-containing protein [Citreimonas salinaria]|uniref:histidine kinase n=1 Tax=Citreimonas salinaria TaxID=321339 RepID=A0A1H3MWG7_9RHOB|nr:HWE histidine kinase domain-containing protein [Citreimonas salinaria]SDY81057.1 Two-component sensor histidine kinase, contains HisKA and HATPase domains [Citreimonas salinaria]
MSRRRNAQNSHVGESMAELVRAFDWRATPLGSRDDWTPSLRIASNLVLETSFPSILAWGPDLCCIYNDAYRPLLGEKHPALGQSPFDIWPEVASELEPIVAAALDGRTYYDEGVHFKLQRRGFAEDAWFDFSMSPVRDEAASVVGILNTAVEVTERKRAETRLLEREARWLRTFEQAPGFIAITMGADHVFSFVNRSFMSLFGERDYLDRPAREVFPEMAGQGFYELMDHVYSTGERFLAQQQPILVAPSDPEAAPTTLFLDFVYEPIQDDDGSIAGIFVEGFDVTERKLAEEKQKLLAREVDHRAKNVLAVVQSMVRLTKADSQPDFVKAVEGRINALSRAHSLLASSQWSGADLSALVTAEVASYGGKDAQVKVLGGPAATLAPDAVQPTAMVLHELLTNAAKYGALSTDGGTVEVQWVRNEDGGVRLHWREVGGPALTGSPPHKGFGSQMVQAASQQLDGGATWDWAPDGLRCSFDVTPENLSSAPAPAAQPAGDTPPTPGDVAGMQVLVVEDEALVAMETCHILNELRCYVIGPAYSLGEALKLAADTAELDIAVLDVNLKGHEVWPVVDLLQSRNVPLLLATGYGDGVERQGLTVLAKPLTVGLLERELRNLVGKR